MIRTAWWDQFNHAFAEKGVTKGNDQAIDVLRAGILIGRDSGPEDIAGLATFLASKESDYITEQPLIVDAGMVLI